MFNRKKLIQFTRFCMVGLGNTTIDFSVFFVLTALGTAYLPAQVISYSAGLGNSFIFNRKWTFQTRGKFAYSQLTRFIILNSLSLLISTAVLYLFHDIENRELWVGKVAATAGSVLINYLGSSRWVFPPQASVRSEVS